MRSLTKARPAVPLSAEEASVLRAHFGRWTSLALDFDRLTPEEQRRLVALTDKARAKGEPREHDVRRLLDPSRLSKRDRARFEALVGKAAGRKDVFEAEREQAEASAELAELAREAVKPRPPLRYEQPGSVHLAAEVWIFIKDGAIRFPDLGLLLLLEFGFEQAQALAPRSRFMLSDGEPTLVFDKKFGPVPATLGGHPGWKASLDRLAAVELVSLGQHGNEVHVQRGSLAKQFIQRREQR